MCAVISGGEFDTFAGIETADFIVAADRGYRYACEQGVRVDLVVGDFDSCDYIWDTGKRPKSSAADCEDNINFDSAGESGAAANFAFPKLCSFRRRKTIPILSLHSGTVSHLDTEIFGFTVPWAAVLTILFQTCKLFRSLLNRELILK
ncbi:hypothetical protein RQN30_03760 [Arcanobacterium hippocoleae]